MQKIEDASWISRFFSDNLLSKSATFLLWLALTIRFILITSIAINNGLDIGGAGAYAYFTANKFQYGTDFMHIVGPYGFIMYGWVYAGYLFWTRMILEILLKGIFSYLIVAFALRSSRSILKWIWLLAYFIFINVGGADLAYDLCFLLGALFLIQRCEEKIPWFQQCLVAGAFGLMALIKGTHLSLAIMTLAFVSFYYVVRGRKKNILGLVGIFTGVFIAAWMAIGQNPIHILQYVIGIMHFSAGYNEALSLQEGVAIFTAGIIVLISLISMILWTSLSGPKNLQKMAIGVLLLCFTFLEWKHGFVRADAHVVYFFVFAILAALTDMVISGDGMLPKAGYQKGDVYIRLNLQKNTKSVVCLVCFCIALYGASEGRMNLGHFMSQPFITLKDNVVHLMSIEKVKKDLDEQLAQNRIKYSLPEIRKVVQHDSIDYFGFELSLLILNQLHYTPRPHMEAFDAFNEYFEKLDRDFVLDPQRRPKYYLLKMATIDNRLLAQDDALALRTILDIYEPILVEKDYLLLRQKTKPAPVMELQMISSAALLPDRSVSLPVTASDKVIYATAQLDLNWLGKLRAFFYKAPMLSLTMTSPETHAEWNYRVIPTMMKMPVMISFLLRDNTDLLRILYRIHPLGVKTITLKIESSMEKYFKTDSFRVTFYEGEMPIMENKKLGSTLLLPFYPGFNIVPELVDTPVLSDIREIGDQHVLLIQAPAEVQFHLTGTEKVLSGDFGFLPGAYTNGGQTDGVRFKVSFMKKGSGQKILFERLLMPVQFKNDQGRQSFKINLPKGHGAGMLSIDTLFRTPGGAAWALPWLANIVIK